MASIGRRKFIKLGVKATAVAGALGFPAILTAKNKYPTIRVLGTYVTLQEALRRRAQDELKINIEFYPGGSAEVLTKAIANPKSFDLYEQWSNSARLLWNSGAVQPIDIKRLAYWDEMNDLPKYGKISPDAQPGAGDVPNKILYVQADNRLGSTVTEHISFMPYVHNVDSYGYNPTVVKEGIPFETESWGWLLNEQFHGRVAVINDPTIGLFDLVLATQAKGLVEYQDIGDLTKGEIDALFDELYRYKEAGHFRGFWNSVPHSVALMKNNEVDIQSMFSPGVSALNGQGIPCIYAAPKEGYRAWFGAMCLSRECEDERKDAAYAYMNWWLSGWPGAFAARQGYYIPNPQRSKPLMDKAEWDYWYGGLPAAHDLRGANGEISVKAGHLRRGGSYQNRFEHVAVWNTVMSNFDYTLKKWNRLLRFV